MNYDLKELREAGRKAVAAAFDARAEIGGAVNWGAVNCCGAERVEDDEGDVFYRVNIDEADGSAEKLRVFVAEHLARAGFVNVSVEAEW
jgi:hypothetical protein